MNDNEILGQRIKALRIEKGITQDELAKRIGYSSRSTINKIELGKHGMHRNKVTAFAQVLNTTVEYLLGITDNSVKHDSYIMVYLDDEGSIKYSLKNEDVRKVMNFIETMDKEQK